jgi:hypothetical protein
MIAVVPPDRAGVAVELLGGRGVPAWQVGEVRVRADADGPAVAMTGVYAGVAATWR